MEGVQEGENYEQYMYEMLMELENEECHFCGWNSCLETSHILHCGGAGCEYIRSLYIVTMEDNDGEPYFKCVDRKTNEIKIIEF